MSSLGWPLMVPVLTDGVVTLRAHVPADLDRMNEMANDPQMVRWTAVPTPHPRTATEKYAMELVPQSWENGTARCWGIEYEGRYVGNVDLRGKGELAELGFALHPDARGLGLSTAATRLVVDHAFVEAGKEVVSWRSQVGNLASLRVAHSLGFRLHGTQPDALLERGRVLDAWTGTLHFGDAPVPRTTWRASTLHTPRLTLRPLTEADAPRIVEACDDASTRHFLSNLPSPYRASDAIAFVHDAWWKAAIDRVETWAMADADDRLLGVITVMGLDDPTGGLGEIGYWTHPDSRGRGLTTEAARAVVEHALDAEGLDRHRLALVAAEGNTASLRIAESLGFTRYGTEHGTCRLADGTITDHHLHERLR